MADWHEIPPHKLLLRGHSDAYLTMTVKMYLADERDGSPAALGMDVEFGSPQLRGFRGPFQFITGYYGCLATVRRELGELRRSGDGVVRFQGAEYISWSLKTVENGSGDELLFDASASTFLFHRESWPTDLSQALKHSMYEHSGACVKFAFITSRIAEPWLEDFTRQLDELNDLLGLW